MKEKMRSRYILLLVLSGLTLGGLFINLYSDDSNPQDKKTSAVDMDAFIAALKEVLKKFQVVNEVHLPAPHNNNIIVPIQQNVPPDFLSKQITEGLNQAVPRPEWASLIGAGICEGVQKMIECTALIFQLQKLGIFPDPNKKSYISQMGEKMSELMIHVINPYVEKARTGEMSGSAALYDITKKVTQASIEVTWQCMPLIGAFVALGAASYGAKRGFDVLKKWMILRMKQPHLLRREVKPHQLNKDLKDLHYTGQTRIQIGNIIAMAKAVAKSKGRIKFENVMLYGDPGTGKTAIVEVIAKEANMMLYATTGGDFAKLQGKDLEQLDEMIRRAKASRIPVLLFIDEMENLFGSRARTQLSEAARNVLTKLLAEFSEPSSQILLMGATNRPEELDEAMHRRMPQQIEVGLPDHAGRVAILHIYRRRLFTEDKKYTKEQQAEINSVLNTTVLEGMATKLGSVAPAELENTMIVLKNRSFTYNNGIPTLALIEEVIAEKSAQLRARAGGFIRTSARHHQEDSPAKA